AQLKHTCRMRALRAGFAFPRGNCRGPIEGTSACSLRSSLASFPRKNVVAQLKLAPLLHNFGAFACFHGETAVAQLKFGGLGQHPLGPLGFPRRKCRGPIEAWLSISAMARPTTDFSHRIRL